MKILFITQVFYPDTVAASQHLWDLAVHLKNNGHKVTCFTSLFSYESKDKQYSKFEIQDGIEIYRMNQSKLGKSNILFRVVDYLTFNINISFKLLFLNKKEYDLIIGTTAPPLLSFITLLIAQTKNIPFHYWVMDLQPELSIASGLIKKESIAARFLTLIGNYCIHNSTRLYSLDRFMTSYLISKGGNPSSVHTIPIWPVVDDIYLGGREENPFRIENSFGDKIVVMYSGNHAYVHPLDTLLNSAKKLKNDNRFLFVFVGGGVRRKDVSNFIEKYSLSNIRQLPFQPRNNIHLSLGSADIQVVIMGEGLVGFTHPNKIYGALFVSKPIIYIGPKSSHITDIINNLPGNISIEHGDSSKLTDDLLEFAELRKDERMIIGNANRLYATINFAPLALKNNMLQVIESY